MTTSVNLALNNEANLAKDGHETLKEACTFMARFASTIIAAGSASARCEKTVNRIAEAYNVDVEMTILPRTVMMTVWDKEHLHSYHTSSRLPGIGLNFYLITKLSTLSQDILDEHQDFATAWKNFNEALNKPRLNPWVVTMLTGAANASFCRLFEGDWLAMLIVFIATVEGFWLKATLHSKWKWDIRLATLVAACNSSIIACSGFLFGLTDTPDIALGTSVLYLVPGIPYINSVSDLIHGHLLCCISRFIHASMLTACLGIGLSLGILIMHISYF